MESVSVQGIHFQPWIGDGYEFKGRLLLLGESHYLNEQPDFEDDFSKGYDFLTNHVIKNIFLKKEPMKTPFFRNIGYMFNANDCFKIWNDIAFANLIQVALSNARSQPNSADIETIRVSFPLLLQYLKPKKVLVLSTRLWKNWIPENDGNYFGKLIENEKKATLWKYSYPNGECLAMGIKHPSRMSGSTSQSFTPLIEKFLSMELT